MKLFEVILLEVVEECSGADRVCRDVEIVNVLLPVRTDFAHGRHGG